MNIHILKNKVYYSDTDAYGVVWHGSYLRWLEAGRVEWCEMLGHNLIDLENQNIVLPVTNLNVRYKASAKLNDNIIIAKTYVSFDMLKGNQIEDKQKLLDSVQKYIINEM